MFSIKKPYEAVNWNRSELAVTLFNQQNTQFWLESDIPVSLDIPSWRNFEYKDTYKKVLAGLTLLDTVQSNIGMLQIAQHTENLQEKSLYTQFAFFEAIHAKSYSRIFTTLCTNPEIDEVFEWIKENKDLQRKAELVSQYYDNITDDESMFKAMFASVMLENLMFFSGFFYPLYLAGQGLMKNSGEIINYIIRDESLHGVSVGLFAQRLFDTFSQEKQVELKQWGYQLLIDIYENECRYTEDVYAETGLSSEVKKYIRYNANKAMMNLNWDVMFEDEEINPMVLNGINNQGSTMDFFSAKGIYTISKSEPITDSTFDVLKKVKVK